MKSCLCCGAPLVSGEERVCWECRGDISDMASKVAGWVGAVAAGSLLGLLILSVVGCASSKTPPNFVPLAVDPYDNRPRPWCKAVEAPQPGEECWLCLDLPTDREQIGRGSGEPCLRRVVATWGSPSNVSKSSPTATPTPSVGSDASERRAASVADVSLVTGGGHPWAATVEVRSAAALEPHPPAADVALEPWIPAPGVLRVDHSVTPPSVETGHTEARRALVAANGSGPLMVGTDVALSADAARGPFGVFGRTPTTSDRERAVLVGGAEVANAGKSDNHGVTPPSVLRLPLASMPTLIGTRGVAARPGGSVLLASIVLADGLGQRARKLDIASNAGHDLPSSVRLDGVSSQHVS